MPDQNSRIVDTIFALLHSRAEGATVCPSEVAREISPDDWRDLMPVVRDVAAKLARAERLDVSQSGVVIQLNAETRGPIRLGLPAPSTES